MKIYKSFKEYNDCYCIKEGFSKTGCCICVEKEKSWNAAVASTEEKMRDNEKENPLLLKQRDNLKSKLRKAEAENKRLQERIDEFLLEIPRLVVKKLKEEVKEVVDLYQDLKEEVKEVVDLYQDLVVESLKDTEKLQAENKRLQDRIDEFLLEIPRLKIKELKHNSQIILKNKTVGE